MLKVKPRLSITQLMSFAGLFVVAGVALVLITLAAGAASYFEPEIGLLTAGATVVTNSGASGGKAVQFGTAPASSPTPTPTPTPLPGGKPTLSNTGARSALRTDLPALTTVASGPTIASGTPGHPTLIRDMHFTDGFTFVGHDILFINCLFDGTTTDQLVEIRDSTPANESIEFRDSTIRFATPAGQHPTGIISGIKFTRTLIYNGDHAIHQISGTGYVSLDSSILDARDSSDNAASIGYPHGNAIYTTDGPAANVTALNTVIYGGNSFVFFNDAANGNGVPINGWVFDGCWFYGNNRNSGWTSGAVFFAGGNGNTFANLHVRNSRFQRVGTGLDALIRGNVTFAEWTNNVWDDNGAAVASP